jgi:hypothetical protein
LYICNEILKRNHGSIGFLAEDDQRNRYGSASFVITFNPPN